MFEFPPDRLHTGKEIVVSQPARRPAGTAEHKTASTYPMKRLEGWEGILSVQVQAAGVLQ